MEILKNVNPTGLKKCEDSNLLEKANRPLNGGNSLYSRGVTVISSTDLYEKEYNIRGNKTKSVVFLGAAYDENGKFVKAVEVSPNSFTRELCPQKDSAVGALRQVENCLQYGDTAKEIVAKMIDKKLAIFAKEVKPLGVPTFDTAANRMDYSNMTLRDRTVYEIRQCPDNVWNDMFKD